MLVKIVENVRESSWLKVKLDQGDGGGPMEAAAESQTEAQREVTLLPRNCSKRADLEKTRKSTLSKAAEFKRTIVQERGDTTEREF